MWNSKSKCQRIGALVKTSHKQLKAVLMLKIRNFGSASIIPKLVDFLFFDKFFPDLAEF